ncbi:MAG: TlpA disulfide reductase family protein [Gemmatimonadota bacterium]
MVRRISRDSNSPTSTVHHRVSPSVRLAALLLLVVSGCREANPKRAPRAGGSPDVERAAVAAPGVGARFPTITLRTLAGDSVKVGDTGTTQPLTLVNIWATWCGPCKAEFPDLQHLHDTYSGRGLRLIAVSTDQRDADVHAFVMSTNATFPIGRDTAEEVLAFLRDGSLPQNILIGTDGRILYKAFGLHQPIDPALTAAIESALGGT